jgi:mannose-6-phosphate isomerase-like protein (cupin superfamily)
MSNQSVYIPQKTPQRLENPTVGPIQFIGVQTGAYIKRRRYPEPG